MRAGLVMLLTAGTLWFGWADWQRTIGEGYAYRLTPIGTAIEAVWPDWHARLISGWRKSSIPYAWDPVGETLMALPLALTLAGLAALFWITRRRRGRS